MDAREIKRRVLTVLRDAREDHGNCHFALSYVLDRIELPEDVPVTDIYDWDRDQGLLYELQDDGLIDMVTNEDPSLMATGEMDWGI